MEGLPTSPAHFSHEYGEMIFDDKALEQFDDITREKIAEAEKALAKKRLEQD